MIERGIGRRTIVTPDSDPQSSDRNDLNRVIERITLFGGQVAQTKAREG
jgi:hypothetical protein